MTNRARPNFTAPTERLRTYDLILAGGWWQLVARALASEFATETEIFWGYESSELCALPAPKNRCAAEHWETVQALE